MPNLIRIKRSSVTATPAALDEGELAYSELSGNLFIGTSTSLVKVIGGESLNSKLANIEDFANHFTLTPATGSVLGGCKVGNGLAIDANGVLSVNGTFGVPEAQVDSKISTAINNLVGSAPAALDTLNEIAAALNDDASAFTTLSNDIATKLEIGQNLGDLNDVVEARGNLGLGSLATQAANSVSISGGSINNITLDGGSF